MLLRYGHEQIDTALSILSSAAPRSSFETHLIRGLKDIALRIKDRQGEVQRALTAAEKAARGS